MPTLKAIRSAAVAFLVFDLLVLSMALLQIRVEGRSGYWSPFWQAQADFVLGLMP